MGAYSRSGRRDGTEDYRSGDFVARSLRYRNAGNSNSRHLADRHLEEEEFGFLKRGQEPLSELFSLDRGGAGGRVFRYAAAEDRA